MNYKTVEELIAWGFDPDEAQRKLAEEAKTFRIRSLEGEAAACIHEAVAGNDSKKALDGLRHYLDLGMLAASLDDDKNRRNYNAASYAYQMRNAFYEVLAVNPKFVSQNQEGAFTLLLGLGMLHPQALAYEASWHIIAEQDIVRDPNQKAIVRQRHQDFLVHHLDPFLFTEMVEARDRQDAQAADNLKVLWETNLQHMFFINRSMAIDIVRRQLKAQEAKPEQDQEIIGSLKTVQELFKKIEELERVRNLGNTIAQSDEPPHPEVLEAYRAARAKLGFLEAPKATAPVMTGTEQASALRNPTRALEMLKKFKPEGPAN